MSLLRKVRTDKHTWLWQCNGDVIWSLFTNIVRSYATTSILCGLSS